MGLPATPNGEGQKGGKEKKAVNGIRQFQGVTGHTLPPNVAGEHPVTEIQIFLPPHLPSGAHYRFLGTWAVILG